MLVILETIDFARSTVATAPATTGAACLALLKIVLLGVRTDSWSPNAGHLLSFLKIGVRSL
jgi:hypothetical protein